MLRDLLMIQSVTTLYERRTEPISLPELRKHMSRIFQRPVDDALLSELSLSFSEVVLTGARRAEFNASQNTSMPPAIPRKIVKRLHVELNGVYRFYGTLDGK